VVSDFTCDPDHRPTITLLNQSLHRFAPDATTFQSKKQIIPEAICARTEFSFDFKWPYAILRKVSDIKWPVGVYGGNPAIDEASRFRKVTLCND
jgi:hypothetical protein